MIGTPSPSDNPSIFPGDIVLPEDMDHLLPSTDYSTQWYGGDSSLTLSDTSNQHDGSPDDGTGQTPHFPAGENSPQLHAILPAFAFLLDLYLPQVRSLVFLVDDTDAASRINETIQELNHPFQELAGVSRLQAFSEKR